MRTLLLAALLLCACGCGNGVVDDDSPRLLPDLSSPDLTGSPGDDPCGPKYTGDNDGAYSCGYLVGNCPSAGLSCYCWENGTMVCQADGQWELITDQGCPLAGVGTSTSYQGLGCLGAHTTCGGCTCDQSTWTYQCPDGGTT